jgi:hypothetical protein
MTHPACIDRLLIPRLRTPVGRRRPQRAAPPQRRPARAIRAEARDRRRASRAEDSN